MWRYLLSLTLASIAIGISGYAFAASEHGPIREAIAGIGVEHILVLLVILSNTGWGSIARMLITNNRTLRQELKDLRHEQMAEYKQQTKLTIEVNQLLAQSTEDAKEMRAILPPLAEALEGCKGLRESQESVVRKIYATQEAFSSKADQVITSVDFLRGLNSGAGR